MNEAEVPPREADRPQVARILRRHPFIHFVIVYCVVFTFVAILDDLSARFWHWPAWSRADQYSFAFSMAVVSYVSYRVGTRFKAATGRDQDLERQ